MFRYATNGAKLRAITSATCVHVLHHIMFNLEDSKQNDFPTLPTQLRNRKEMDFDVVLKISKFDLTSI